jgi:fimbrial isopeptide formation D2 family protein/LPXTG-motif cell wall-anchored protein
MKSIKKLLTLALAMVMMFAMTITAAATETDTIEEPVTITVQNLTQGATIAYMQILRNTDTGGWEIVDNDDVKAAFNKLTTAEYPDPIKAYEKASESARLDAFADLTCDNTSGVNGNVITVTEAGLYLIQATDTSGEYVYKNMIAYVGFEYGANGVGKITNAVVNAKMQKNQIEKTADVTFIEQTDEVTYTVKTAMPYVPAGAVADETTGYLVSIKDTLTGGKYKATNNKMSVGYTMGSTAGTIEVDVIANADGTESCIIPLDQFITTDGKNGNAGKEIILTYTANITAEVMDNEAVPNYWGHEDKETSFTVVTGKIIITKTDEENKPLAEAQFVILKGNKYATLDDSKKLTGWVDTIEEATKITTSGDGEAIAYGFDRDEQYKAVEYAAPPGYSVKDTPIDLTWVTDETNTDGKINTVQTATGSLGDTTLIQLPFTGGSGTAAFTGLGVLFMSIAAALYFINKNKKNKSIK